MSNELVNKVCQDLQDCGCQADEAVVKKMAATYRLVMSKADARSVSCGDPAELATVKKNFMQKKLGLTDTDEELDQHIKAVCEAMQAKRQKNRMCFYYLLAERTGKLDVFR